jgi:hypothetical protein
MAATPVDLETWLAGWRALERSTEPIDLYRASAAVRALYRERGLAMPKVRLVPSPVAGMQVWHYLARVHEPLRNPFTRGDIGNGANRAFNALADPFGLDPAWVGRILRRAESGIPRRDDPGGPRLAGPLVAAVEAWFRGTQRPHDGDRRMTSGDVPPEVIGVPQDPALARAIVGERWAALSALLGEGTLEEMVLVGVAHTINEILDPRPSLREAARAMQIPVLDPAIRAMGLLREGLGLPVWRQRAQRTDRTADVERRLELARAVGAWWALDGLALVCERPRTLAIDERGRLHSDVGPAAAWADGFAVWAQHGVMVPDWVVLDPGRITVEGIDDEDNAEVRRVMIERFGAERLIREGGAKLEHEDETGRLWSRRLRNQGWREEPVVMVEVVNSTPEPDGSRKTYHLRVPPTMRTARQAVAWTFAMGSADYSPVHQT